jgi:uncharacterized DUF497 family protein
VKFDKPIRWNNDKNETLQRERSVSFEEILAVIEGDGELASSSHPNQAKYPNQTMLYIPLKGYVYLVPYVETDNEVFLKTIIPSRKATKQFSKEKHHD